jgi:DNA-binding response OmpR family regulator
MDNDRTGGQKRTINLLWVEDLPEVFQAYAFYLEFKLGATVDFASTGETAMCKVERNQYDVIIAEVHVPGMHGFELACHLRQAGIKIPILLTSVSDYGDYEVRSFGADAFLPKPFSFDELVNALEELLRHGAGLYYPQPRERSRAQTAPEGKGADRLKQRDEGIATRFKAREAREGD